MREAGSLPQDDGVIRIVGRVLRRQRTEGGALFPALEDKVDAEPLASFHVEAVGPNVNLRSCVDNKIMNPTAGGKQHLHDFPPGPWLPTPSLQNFKYLWLLIAITRYSGAARRTTSSNFRSVL